MISEDRTFVLLSESGSTKSYFQQVGWVYLLIFFSLLTHYQEWSQLATKIVESSTKLLAAEKEAFDNLRAEVNLFIRNANFFLTYLQVNFQASLLRRNARILEELDVTLSFAELAVNNDWKRPTVLDSMEYSVINGRHPTVELGLNTSGRLFMPNSIHLDVTKGLQQVITGPNMGGKSTFLRQAALISILAQAGSFVPADSATLGIVDKIFSRVGAKDDLYHDRSTFMVEMLETADILSRASPKSLVCYYLSHLAACLFYFNQVIMDEVGRGTTVRDGLAIAFATIHHLTTVNQCRTLFATHFHELSHLLGYDTNNPVYSHIGYHCFDVDETEVSALLHLELDVDLMSQDGHFAYSYRIRQGVNFDSHGLKVAKIAGMPDAAMRVAQSALKAISEGNSDLESLRELGISLYPTTLTSH